METIRFAENIGLIADFDMAVLKLAIEKLQSVPGHMMRPVGAINLSGKSLSTPLFVDRLTRTLKNHVSLKGHLALE